ncbi:MAG: hypothetical protein R3F43_21845 [bacterium]
MKLAGAPLLLAALAAAASRPAPRLRTTTSAWAPSATARSPRRSCAPPTGSLVRLTQIEADVRVQLAREGDAATVAVHHEAARGRRSRPRRAAWQSTTSSSPTGRVAIRPRGPRSPGPSTSASTDPPPGSWLPRGPPRRGGPGTSLPDRLRPDASWQATLPSPASRPPP